ncbi:MAG TPA: cyclic nucleotide-binding domain-containing protein [Candidatus Brocadiia bacterium]|nr:cyclic nucleotide-binding domain-containing protein [Planctomycetota bacterium]MBI4007908.1 cyclic nucleotide-binding domain-containing protein [Planctomycetota bacterium]MDO8093273.1 cyclic nucleotide-binding domain-containing protein [Candidatus Brocadiales bacterium]
MEQFLTKKNFKKGETIIKEGSESYDVYIILSGEAEILKTYFGKTVAVRTLKKGDVFGALALIAKSPRVANVVAKTDLEVGLIYRDDFLSMLEKLPAEVSEILKGMVTQLRDAYEVSAELVIHTKKMLSIKERLESLQWEKLKDYSNQLPEVAQIVVTSLEHGLADMLHSYFKLANQLDRAVIDVDNIFTQSTGVRT